VIGFWEILLILVIVLIILGPKKLPELAKALGKAMKVYKQALEEPDETSRRTRQKRVKKPAG